MSVKRYDSRTIPRRALAVELERLIDERGLTLSAVAREAGISVQMFCNRLNSRNIWRCEELERVIRALGIDDPEKQEWLYRLAAREAGYRV